METARTSRAVFFWAWWGFETLKWKRPANRRPFRFRVQPSQRIRAGPPFCMAHTISATNSMINETPNKSCPTLPAIGEDAPKPKMPKTDRADQKQNDPPHGDLPKRTEPDDLVKQQPDDDQERNGHAQQPKQSVTHGFSPLWDQPPRHPDAACAGKTRNMGALFRRPMRVRASARRCRRRPARCDPYRRAGQGRGGRRPCSPFPAGRRFRSRRRAGA